MFAPYVPHISHLESARTRSKRNTAMLAESCIRIHCSRTPDFSGCDPLDRRRRVMITGGGLGSWLSYRHGGVSVDGREATAGRDKLAKVTNQSVVFRDVGDNRIFYSFCFTNRGRPAVVGL